jgi:modulator of FtsH protease
MNEEMMNYQTAALPRSNQLVRDTYRLLSATLVVTALMAWLGMWLQMGMGAYLVCAVGGFALMFVVMKTRNSGWGLVALMAFACLEGLSLGPIVSHYARSPDGAQTVSLAALLTGVVFGGLSFYVHTTRRDFSAWSGMLYAGIIVLVLASLVGLFVHSSAYQMTLAAISALVFSGFILFDTSRIVRGEETNYIMATMQLYLDIVNLFLDLLQLLGNRR